MNTITLLWAVAELYYTEACRKAKYSKDFKTVMKALEILSKDEVEPLSRLDQETRDKVMKRVRNIARDLLT